jgi:hypothetical protein
MIDYKKQAAITSAVISATELIKIHDKLSITNTTGDEVE